jgi:hypothetical protein
LGRGNKGTRVTIHQPEHFPYMGFFQKMKAADLFIILDNVKFRKNYFQNRNRYLSKQGKDEWFGVAVPKKSSSSLIKDIKVVDDSVNPWKKKIINRVRHNLGFDLTNFYESDSLVEVNLKGIHWARRKMGISVPMIRASTLECQGTKSHLLVEICKEVGAETYLSGPTGKSYLDLEMFERENIQVQFFEPEVENHYSCLYNLL